MEEIEVEGAAEAYVELFNRYGVDYVISSPGTEFVPLWEYLAKYSSQGKKPSYINARHEGTALTMAKGYAMATGRPQVVLTHVIAGLLHIECLGRPEVTPLASGLEEDLLLAI